MLIIQRPSQWLEKHVSAVEQVHLFVVDSENQETKFYMKFSVSFISLDLGFLVKLCPSYYPVKIFVSLSIKEISWISLQQRGNISLFSYANPPKAVF